MSKLNVVDSSGWLEYLADTNRSELFASAIEDTPNLIVPIITVYEVFKKFLRERGEAEALEAASVMREGQIVEIDFTLVLEAARHRLALADSLIYATALAHGATLWTQDEHFRDLPSVHYFAKLPADR